MNISMFVYIYIKKTAVKVFENLIKYKSENKFVDHQNNYAKQTS